MQLTNHRAMILLAFAVTLSAAGPGPSVPVILISVDTLRADHLGCYGYARPVSKAIDALAAGATRFAQANTTAPLTLPSHTALFTSRYPFETGVRDNGEPLGRGAATLASVLKSAGYRTAAVVGGFVLDARFGLNQGFDTYDGVEAPAGGDGDAGELKRPAGEVTAAAIRWLDGNGSAPFFLFVHYFDVHTPYVLPAAYRPNDPEGGYDAAIRYVDDNVRDLMAYLDRRGLTRKALIVFLSDHGEGLGDHGERSHGFFVYQSTMRVPLLVRFPSAAPRMAPVVDSPVSLVDVAPTVLDFLGVPIPRTFQGKGLLPLARGSAAPERDVYGESAYAHRHFGCATLLTMRQGRMKYIDAPQPELYDLAADPGEKTNLYDRRQAVAQPLRDRVQPVHRRPPAQSRQPAPEVVQKLQSLGYLASAAPARPSQAGADPKDKIADYELSRRATALALGGRPADAVPLYERVLARNPGFTETRMLLGLAQQKLGRNQEALAAFRSVLQSDSWNVQAHVDAGLSLVALGRLDEAIKELEAAVEIGRGTGASSEAYASAEEMLGRVWLQKRDYSRARAQFETLLEHSPSNFTAHYNLGWLATLQSRWDDGQRHLQAAAQAEPRSPLPHNALGNLYLRRGSTAEAEKEFQAALRLDPNDAWAHYNAGVILEGRGRSLEAVAEYRRALELNPQLSDAAGALKRLNGR